MWLFHNNVSSQEKSSENNLSGFEIWLIYQLLPFHTLLGSRSCEVPLRHPSLVSAQQNNGYQKPPESGPIVLLCILHEFIGSHNISISPEGINQAITICSMKFVMSVCGDARCCGTTQLATPSISITTVTLGELYFPHGQWRGKAIMQVAHESERASARERERDRERIPE